MTSESATEQALCRWMVDAVARLARMEPAAIGPATAFDEIGLSSLAAVSLATELSDAFGIDVDPMVTWDHPTIGEVAHEIAQRIAGASQSG